MHKLATLDAIAQADLLRRREVTPLELIDAAISRIEKVNPKLNAVIHPLFEKARSRAVSKELPTGVFGGVPFLLKDLDTHSAGDPFHCGMKHLRDLGWTEKNDSFLVEKFRAAGLICLGKTNTPELGLNATTEPQAYGPTRNPWNLDHSTGGSSGGSAAAVAAGLVPVAHASDGGGSIRIPASECGLVGLKPSRGRVSLGPEYGEYWNGLVTQLVVTRTVRDTAAVLDAVSDPMPGDLYVAPAPRRSYREEVGADPGRLRVGFVAKLPMGELPADCVAASTGTAKLLESLGHRVEDSYPTALFEPELLQHFGTVVAAWVASSLEEWGQRTGRPVTPESVEPMTWAHAEMGRGVNSGEYVDTLKWLAGFTRRMAGWWASGFDLLVTPTLGAPPPRIGELAAASVEKILGFIPFTPPFNVTGQPAVSLPLHWSSDGLPIGVQLIAAYGREDLLIRVAAQLEQAKPWVDRRPPIRA